MKTFVISLTSAAARRASIRRQFAGFGLSFSFFDAFAGGECLNQAFDGIDSKTYRLNTYREALPGEIGCYSSHLALWKLAAKIDEPIVILEDDSELRPNFLTAVQTAGQLIGELGFIRLQGHERNQKLHLGRDFHTIGAHGDYRIHYLSVVPLCLQGYVISPSVGSRLAAASRILTSPVDKFVQRTWEHGNPIFALSPASVSPSILDGDSTIGTRPITRKKSSRTIWQRARYKIAGDLQRKSFDRQHLKRLIPN